MSNIELHERYPLSRREDITDAYMRGVEFGRKMGRGTCEWQLVKSGPCYLVCRCSVCGYEHAESMTDKGATDFDPSFCPSCGREVMDE